MADLDLMPGRSAETLSHNGADLGPELARERDRVWRLDLRVAELELQLLEAEQRVSSIGELELELRDVTTRCDETVLEHRRRLQAFALEAAEKEAEHRRLEADLGEAQALLERARRVQNELVTSLSWRVTAPMRALRGLRGG